MPKRFRFLCKAMLTSSMLLLTAAGTAMAALESVTSNTPEIDAGSAASALTLIVGSAMLLKDKFRSK